MKETGQVYSPESRDLNLDEEDESPDIKGNILDFVLPIGVLIALTIVTGELFLALIAAIAVCFLLYIPRKKMTAARFCDLAMHGFCNMIPTVAIIFFVFVMQQGMTDIGIASYVIDAVRPVISPVLLPAITFLLVAALNFATGSTWGIPALVSPIILPLALSIGVNPLVVMGAIVSGDCHMPRAESIRIAGKVIREFEVRHPDIEVTLVLYREGVYEMARRLLAQDKPDSTEADVGRSEPEPGKSPDRPSI